MTYQSKKEYIEWAKKRALAFLEQDNLEDAFNSMLSDMKKNPETSQNPALQLGLILRLSGQLNTKKEIKDFIEKF